MAAVETYQLRGKNYDDVVRQLVQTYNSSEGWAVVRVVNRLTSLDVILERNSEQGVSKDTVKATAKEVSKDTPTEKVVDADTTASNTYRFLMVKNGLILLAKANLGLLQIKL